MTSSDRADAPVGLIGLGLLGSVLGERLLDAGYSLHVFNRSREKAEPLLARGAVWSDNPFAACDRVVVCLYTTSVVEQVLASLGGALRPGQTVLDATTGDPHETAALGGWLAERGVAYLEAPIAASSDQTRRGQAVALCAGDEAVFLRHQALLECLAPKTFYVGPWGSAVKVKLVNNLVLGLNRVALAEGLVFARALGLDAARTLAILKQGNAYSVAMDVKGRKMLEEDFAADAKLSQHLKDVRLILAEAEAAGVRLPASQLHRRLLEHAEARGWGELDNSVILKAVETFPDGAP